VLTRVACATTLAARVRDQAELHRLLRHVSSLGLTLLEIIAIDEAGQPLGLHEQVLREHRARRRGMKRDRTGARLQVEHTDA
jgi:hypothetical protein